MIRRLTPPVDWRKIAEDAGVSMAEVEAWARDVSAMVEEVMQIASGPIMSSLERFIDDAILRSRRS